MTINNATLFGKKAATQKLIAAIRAPTMQRSRQPQTSINPATNIPTSCVTPYNTKWKTDKWILKSITASEHNTVGEQM